MSAVRKISLAGALLGAAVWMGVMAISATSVQAQDVNSQDSATAGAPASDASATDDTESPDALPISVGGPWSGTITDDSLLAGGFAITFDQKNRKLNGGWTATFSNEPEFLGDFKGKSTSKKVDFNLSSGQFDKNSCRLKFKSVTAGGGYIQGNYKWVNCGKQFKGDKGGSIVITPYVP
jgi:hypothetical protein